MLGKKWDRYRKRPIWLQLMPALWLSKQISKLYIRVHIYFHVTHVPSVLLNFLNFKILYIGLTE